MKHRSTHPSRYFERTTSAQMMRWKSPTWLERNGEFIVAVLGGAVIAVAAGSIVGALIVGRLS